MHLTGPRAGPGFHANLEPGYIIFSRLLNSFALNFDIYNNRSKWIIVCGEASRRFIAVYQFIRQGSTSSRLNVPATNTSRKCTIVKGLLNPYGLN